jgi:tRNA dimethylallyltransferase
MQAIGYRQVVEHLRGERSLSETIELVKTKTRKFAKRQMTWFRGQLDLQWLDLETQSAAHMLVERIAAEIGQQKS